MNEKKAIVFFFVVVFFFFCFSCLLLVVVVVASSTYVVTYVFLSFVLCFGCVCVFFFSSSFASLTCASVCSYVCDCVCVCVFQFPLFAAVVVVVFFSGASQFQTLPFLRTLFLLFRFYVVIRGGVFLHFFFHVSNKTRTHVHTYRHGHRRTDGRREKSARAPLVLGSTHKTILRFLLLCVIAIIMVGCCCYSLFMGCFLALLINRDRVRYMHTLS